MQMLLPVIPMYLLYQASLLVVIEAVQNYILHYLRAHACAQVDCPNVLKSVAQFEHVCMVHLVEKQGKLIPNPWNLRMMKHNVCNDNHSNSWTRGTVSYD